jgi:hypothetical protein
VRRDLPSGAVTVFFTDASSLDLFAAAAAAHGDVRRAAIMLAATEASREAMGVGPDEDEEAVRAKALEALRSEGNVIEDVWDEGRGLDLESALEFATAHDIRTLQAKEVG